MRDQGAQLRLSWGSPRPGLSCDFRGTTGTTCHVVTPQREPLREGRRAAAGQGQAEGPPRRRCGHSLTWVQRAPLLRPPRSQVRPGRRARGEAPAGSLSPSGDPSWPLLPAGVRLLPTQAGPRQAAAGRRPLPRSTPVPSGLGMQSRTRRSRRATLSPPPLGSALTWASMPVHPPSTPGHPQPRHAGMRRGGGMSPLSRLPPANVPGHLLATL